MKVLMFSTDAKIFEEGTDARARMLEYGGLFEELHLVILSGRTFDVRRSKFEKIGNTFFYATNSRWKISRLFDAYKIAKTIIIHYSLFTNHPVISTQDPFETGIVGYMLKRKFRIPLQVQVHTDFFSPYFAAESWKNKLRVIVGRRIVRAADSIRAVSERIKRTLVGEGDVAPEKISVLPIFVDAAALRAALPAFDLRKKYPQFGEIILMASRLTKEKNIGLAIAAMQKVIKKYPHAGLVIVGEGPEKPKLELYAKRYTLNANIVFEPWTNDLASYYKGADVFLMTSNYEGYGRTAVGAAVCGLPVVMTDVGLAGDFIADGFNGVVCPVGDARAVTEALLRLLDKPSLRQEFGMHHGEVLSQLPSHAQYLAKYKELLEKTLYASA